MAENRNVAVVGNFEAIMRPKARLVGRLQASAIAMLKAGRKPDRHRIYLNATLDGSEKGENVNTKVVCIHRRIHKDESTSRMRCQLLIDLDSRRRSYVAVLPQIVPGKLFGRVGITISLLLMLSLAVTSCSSRALLCF